MLLAPVFSFATPSHVILIRHAEKQKNGLSSQGQQRANDLVGYFTTQPMIGAVGPVDAIYAFRPKADGHEDRGVLTMTPLSNAIHIDIDTHYAKADVTKLAQQIMSDPSYTGKTVLICWEHTHIQLIAEALGAKNAPKWPSKTYDETWILDFDDSGNLTNFSTSQQKFGFN
jgi:hypothetical protein